MRVHDLIDAIIFPIVLTDSLVLLHQAVVAAIDLRHYSPTTITFGSPRSILLQDDTPCTDFPAEKHYRFINTLDGEYDAVSFGTTSMSSSLGQTLFLDDVNFPIGYPGLNADQTREPHESALHDSDLYRERIRGIMEQGAFVLRGAF